MKDIEITLSLKITKREHRIYQKFSYNKRDRNTRFLRDKRYILCDRFNNFILNNSLSIKDKLEYIEYEDTDDGVLIKYEILDETVIKDLPINKVRYKTIMDIVPDNPGCENCIYRKKLTDVFDECEFKEKAITKYLKNCKFFKQKLLY